MYTIPNDDPIIMSDPNKYTVEVITKNAIQCVHCNEEIESVHRHDFRFCKCGKVAVDGGREYRRRVFEQEGDYIEKSIFHLEEREWKY